MYFRSSWKYCCHIREQRQLKSKLENRIKGEPLWGLRTKPSWFGRCIHSGTQIRYSKFLLYFAWLLSVVQLVYSWNLLRACFTPIKPWACQMLPLLVQCHHCIFEHIVFLYRDLQEFTTDKLLMERQIVLIVHLFRYKENLGFIG